MKMLKFQNGAQGDSNTDSIEFPHSNDKNKLMDVIS